MTVQVEALGEADREDWETFVAAAENGTLFHRLLFLSYHSPARFNFHHLVFRRDDRLVALLPAALTEEEGETTLSSPAGASFGGPVLASSLPPSSVEEVIEALVEHARDAGWRRVRLIPPPAVYWRGGESGIFAALTSALEAAGFRPAGEELTQEVPLGGGQEELWNRLDRQARKAIQKGRREGVEVAESRQWERFYRLLEGNRGRHGVRPTHSLEELQELDSLVGNDLVLLLARLGGTLAGGTLIFRCQDRVALNFYLCHDDKRQAERPSDLLVWESMLWAQREGCAHYDFGTSSVGGTLNKGLWRFKKKFGARDSSRPGFLLQLAG